YCSPVAVYGDCVPAAVCQPSGGPIILCTPPPCESILDDTEVRGEVLASAEAPAFGGCSSGTPTRHATFFGPSLGGGGTSLLGPASNSGGPGGVGGGPGGHGEGGGGPSGRGSGGSRSVAGNSIFALFSGGEFMPPASFSRGEFMPTFGLTTMAHGLLSGGP